jgi:hypothetical protein
MSKMMNNLLSMTFKELNEKKALLTEQIEQDTIKGKDLWQSLLEDVQTALDIKHAEAAEKREQEKREKEEEKRQKDLERAIEEEKKRILMAEEEERKMAIVRAEAAKRAEEERKRLAEEAERRRIEDEKRAVEEAERRRKEEEFEKAVKERMEEIILNDIEMKEKIHKEAMRRLSTDKELRQTLMEEMFAAGKISA